ncbi:probable LIM domain-containing serine/threonine-protein kinase DDB_G0286997 [Armigeres subalbatus]|uniref:probable LIM domain-containing serine/threonine-protein kinase DDB_G0286997 n=1 Tax=Armigeres subalbatus TaxID=124917 RepID=UPI002ED42741
MNENLAKICRICLTEGSRHIFQKTVTNDALYNVSSLNRISEKLRYVTLLKVDEMENLPPMICDLCIVQLNVAYNFKRQATESDTKLRQYLIENGIDIMKDIRALPAIRAADQIAIPERLLPASNRANQRLNSTSSSSVFEVPQSTSHGGLKTNGRVFEPRLVPIRIKVETPETVEPSSEPGDLLSNSTISPLSSVTMANGTAPVALPSPHVASEKTNSTENIAIDSSPSSSKNGRDSAMVVVNSRNISLQGDDDYVQNILGSNSSLSTNASKSVEKIDSQPNPTKTSESKEKHESPADNETPQERRLKSLLSHLRINMVNSRFPQSKLRTKPRKKLQKLKLKEQSKHNLSPKPASKPVPKTAPKQVNKPPPMPKSAPIPSLPTVARRHSLDLSQLLNGTRVKAEQKNKSPEKRSPLKKSSHVISPSKLRSLRDLMREERSRIINKTKNKDLATSSGVVSGQKVHDDKNKTVS